MESSERIRESKKEDFFPPIDGAEGANDVTEIESYCVNCGQNGMTKLLLTKIPFYKDVIISSFSCQNCDYSNNEISSAGEICKDGYEYNLKVVDSSDLNRQIIKSDYASIKIPQLDFEIPSKTQKGDITTAEGILQRISTNLASDQPLRKIHQPEQYEKIQSLLEKIEKYLICEDSFNMIIRDVSGNAFVSTPSGILPGQKDERLTLTKFTRTTEENNVLGIYPEFIFEDQEEEENEDKIKETGDVNFSSNEVLEFPTNCSNCAAKCQTKMKITPIPHFKEVVVMATDCDNCGHRTNEIKSGSGIEKMGKKYILQVKHSDDFSRDLLKSETCSIEIPELELEFGSGLLGGKFTTLEGILHNIRELLMDENPLISGDSTDAKMKERMKQFCLKFDSLLSFEVPFTLILDDVAGNSYLQSLPAPGEDPQLKIEEYERSFEQNETLGLNDINTENY